MPQRIVQMAQIKEPHYLFDKPQSLGRKFFQRSFASPF